MKVRLDLIRHESSSRFALTLSPLRVTVDVSQISGVLSVLLIESRRSDTRCTCTAFLLCEAWCDFEALKIVKMTFCSTYTGRVSPMCECACANAGCSES